MTRRLAPLVALLTLFALHHDLWLWDDPRLVGGIPIGLAYHIGYCLAAAALMALLVRFAWPAELDADGPRSGGAGS